MADLSGADRIPSSNDKSIRTFRKASLNRNTKFSSSSGSFRADNRYNGPKVQSMRDMLRDMFDLLRTPDLDLKILLEEFQYLYQPQYKEEVKKFLNMMGKYSIPQLSHPVLNRQSYILPVLLEFVSPSQ